MALLGFAVVAALLHLSRFYYCMAPRSCGRSLIMLCAGAALLLAGVALRNRKPESGEAA